MGVRLSKTLDVHGGELIDLQLFFDLDIHGLSKPFSNHRRLLGHGVWLGHLRVYKFLVRKYFGVLTGSNIGLLAKMSP